MLQPLLKLSHKVAGILNQFIGMDFVIHCCLRTHISFVTIFEISSVITELFLVNMPHFAASSKGRQWFATILTLLSLFETVIAQSFDANSIDSNTRGS